MKVFRSIGRGVKAMVNFPGWMGTKQLSQSGKDIGTVAKKAFTVSKSSRTETFDEAVRRLRLSEADLADRQQRFLKLAKVYCLFGLGLFIYTLYLTFMLHLAAALLSFILTVLAFSLAFRQHFWYFQMKQRKLGCTFKEWVNAFKGGRK